MCALSGVGGHVSKDVTAESLNLLFLVTVDRLHAEPIRKLQTLDGSPDRRSGACEL